MNRRHFLKKVGIGGVGLAGIDILGSNFLKAVTTTEKLESIKPEQKPVSIREFLAEATLKRKFVDDFLSPKKENWAKFDPVLGYTMKDCVIKDGVDGSLTSYNFDKNGERKMINYADKPCRINTYGNSFTECHQVSNGETWQEYLAAHIGEPIRNFGVGGYGVYQAYRRMLRHETKGPKAEYIILNIWNNDHYRSLHKWRWLEIEGFRKAFVNNYGKSLRRNGGQIFHANPWAHIEIDIETGNVIERENPYPTPESLYKLCDADHVYEAFKDDFTVQIVLAKKTGRFDYPDKVIKLCKTLGIDCRLQDKEECRRAAEEIYTKCAFIASKYIVKKASEFAAENKRKFMVLLSYGGTEVREVCMGKTRFDEDFVDFLRDNKIPFVDALQKHVEDYKKFGISPIEYTKRYYIGHYNPLGNHFFAFAIKDEVSNWLEPKPPAYSKGS